MDGVCQQAATQLASSLASEPKAGSRTPACGGQATASVGHVMGLKDVPHLHVAQGSPRTQPRAAPRLRTPDCMSQLASGPVSLRAACSGLPNCHVGVICHCWGWALLRMCQ